MLYHAFPDLRWLKTQAENRFASGKTWNGEQLPTQGWPTVLLNVKSGSVFRDNIPGPLSLFSNISGESYVRVDGRTSVVNDDYFFITNNTQRYTLEIKTAETFNVHFGQNWLHNIVDNREVEFFNKLYPKDDVVRYLQAQLKLPAKTNFEREELLTQLVVHLLRVNNGEKIKLENLSTAKLATREEILRRLHLATDFIYGYYSSDLSLDDLSKVAMLSKFHFLRAFKQAFGVAPHKFLNNVRMEKAKDLLKSDLEIAAIGKMVGINDSSSFSRLFKNEIGVYPSIFRSQDTGVRIQESGVRIQESGVRQNLNPPDS
jgi:AraC family transcriptional regulator